MVYIKIKIVKDLLSHVAKHVPCRKSESWKFDHINAVRFSLLFHVTADCVQWFTHILATTKLMGYLLPVNLYQPEANYLMDHAVENVLLGIR